MIVPTGHPPAYPRVLPTSNRRRDRIVAAAAGLVVLGASLGWLVAAFGNLDPCGAGDDLSSVCAAPPSWLRAGQLAVAVAGGAAGVLAGSLAVLGARRGHRRWLGPSLTLFGVLVLAWVVLFDAGILTVGS